MFANLIRSEWVKIRTVGATAWCLLTLTALAVGVAALIALKEQTQVPRSLPVLVNMSQLGLSIGQLAVVVLAATNIGGEYGTGMIRTSLVAVPRRARWLLAKAIVVGALALVTGIVLSVISFAIVYASAPADLGTLADPQVIRAVLGVGLYLGVLAVLSLAVTTIVRGTAGGIIVMFVLIFVVPFAVGSHMGRFLPVGTLPPNAGLAITQVEPMLGGLAPWVGFAVLCAWTVAAMAVALYRLVRRDA
ncbi:ABC transporter permease [Streptomyces sp. Je 1-4]|uniref:ABC transporter permease n=1 Tax=Streptomyces TaxID=1883 RepID=UPI0021D9CC04|nr:MULTISPECIES: ABC transporter permease [unclassified Streptomyces]UYB43971.1 ABC transporter permease [Streptomyces sp. Je 1-4]UZQ40398.1 ABC transporter permease [Streptomyces sp. Je 1-4] [Streptomyces sp. Je 1-4 4N24]UZQ47815.1 ABC transporter permease [Streptomyces sp. Je 1-4] [Streptomyces sp. Je 1-4 4N24_ara]